MISNIFMPTTEPIVKENIGKAFFEIMHKMLALIIIAWMNSGIFTYTLPYVPNYIRMGLFFVWFSLAILNKKNFFKLFLIQSWPLLLFYFYIIYMSFFVHEVYFDRYTKSLPYLLMVYSIFLYYFDTKYLRFQKVLIRFLFLDCVFVGINTYIKLQENPLLARYLSTGTDVMERLLGDTSGYNGVGSYGYFYAIVPVILLSGFLFMNHPKRKILALLSIVAFSIVLIKASFTTAILFTFAFFIVMVGIRVTNKITFSAVTVLGLIILTLSRDYISSMFYNFASISGISDTISSRFVEIGYFLSNANMSGTEDFGERIFRYTISMGGFANNILFGTLFSQTTDSSTLGGHSSWLDSFSLFGLVFIIFYVFLFKAYKYTKDRVPTKFRPFVNVYWLYFICLGFVNTLLFSSIFAIWFLFLPMAIKAFYGTSESVQNCR